MIFSTGLTRLFAYSTLSRQDTFMSKKPALTAKGLGADVWRSRVYSAEDQFSAILNRGGLIDFFGSRIQVDPQRRFGDIESVRAYVELVTQLISTQYVGIGSPRVRIRRGATKAHYEYATKTIALPVADQWALRESVILHEYAHHLNAFLSTSGVSPHGPEFTATMLILVKNVLGESAALLLRTGYQEAGVPIAILGDSR
jgi:putative metallohydrolase (TIGR04338 family)